MTLPQSTTYVHPDFQKQFLASSTPSRPCDWFHEKSISSNDVNNNNKHELDQMTGVWTEAATQWKRMKRMVNQNQRNNPAHQPNPQVGRNFGLLNRRRRNRQQNSHNTQHFSSSSSSSSHESDGDDFDSDNKKANNKPDVQGTPLGSFKSFARGEKTLLSLLGISDDTKNNNNNNSLMFRSLESVLEVETVQDMEKWSSCLSDIHNNNNFFHVMSTNRSSSSSSSSFVTSTPPSSATNANNFSLQKLLAPEAQRWMNLAEKNLLLFSLSSDKNQNSNNAGPDFVNAIKNYSNALQSQLNFCLSPNVKTSNDDKTKDQDGYSTASEVKQNPPPMTSTSHQASGSSFSKIDSCDNNTSVYFSSRIQNVHQKSIIALILSNRAACRLALLDFEGCLIDANEAVNFSSKHASALLRLTYCLLFGCSLASSSSTSTSSSSVALLEKCESVSYSSLQTLFSNHSSASSRNTLDAPTTNTNIIIPISVISNSAMDNLREIVKNLNEFENFRNKNSGNDNNVVQWLQSLESASSAAQNIFCPGNNNNYNSCSSVTVRDPRFEILKLELLIASGAFEDAAMNATSLLSSYSISTSSSLAAFLPQVWSLRGSCVFRATPDGNSASLAATCFKKSADCYRKLSQDIGRIFCFVPFLSVSQKNANSNCGNHNNNNNSLSYLTISASKQTLIGDSLQKFDRLETKLSHFFDDYFSNSNDHHKSINLNSKPSSSSSSNHHHNFHEIIQIATEILCLDLLGHRLVRAFTLLRRSILFLLLIAQENKKVTSQNNVHQNQNHRFTNSASNRNSIASRGIDDATTALKLLEIDGEFFAASSSCPTSTRNGSKNNKNSHHDSKSISTLSSSCLPFTIALFCIRAQLHQLVSAFGRASEDLEFALLCSSILSEQRQQDLKNNNDDEVHDFLGQNTEERDDDDHEQESGILHPQEQHNAKRFSHLSSASSSSSALLLRHPEIATYCNRTFLFDLQELIKSQRFAYHQTYQHQQQEHQRKTNKFFKRQREEAANGNNKYSQEDFDREEEELKKNAAKSKRKLDGRGDDDDGDDSENENKDERENAAVVKLSYYDILGIARTAEHSDVVKAYRAAALKWHPDKWMDSSKNEHLRKQAEENFKLLNSAYLVLKDEIQRIKYDASL